MRNGNVRNVVDGGFLIWRFVINLYPIFVSRAFFYYVVPAAIQLESSTILIYITQLVKSNCIIVLKSLSRIKTHIFTK